MTPNMTALLSRHIVIIYILSTCYGVSHGNEGFFFTDGITAALFLLAFLYSSFHGEYLAHFVLCGEKIS